MRQSLKKSNCTPLFMNFVSGKKYEDNNTDLKFVYDPIHQVAYYLGGGSSSGPRETKKGGHRTDRVVSRKADGSPAGVSTSWDDDARYVQDR